MTTLFHKSSLLFPVLAVLAAGSLEATVNPDVEVSASVSPDAVCIGTDVTFSATGTPDGGSYSWSGDVSGSSSDETTSFDAEGTYEGTVTYTVTDDDGNDHSDSTTVSVDVSEVDAAIQGEATPCLGEPQTYTADVCPAPDGSETWDWSSSEGDTSSTDSITLTFDSDDEVTLDLTYTINGVSATDTFTIEPALPGITVADPADAYVGDTVTWEASASCLNEEDIEWSGDDGLDDSESFSITHVYDEPGTYSATASDSWDESSDSGEVVIKPNCPEPSGSRTFGTITATWSGTLTGTEIDGSDFCSFSTTADLSFTTGSPYSVSVSVSDADIDWEENDNGDVQNVEISWTGTEDVGEIGYLTCQVTEIDATDSSGTVTFGVNLSSETVLVGGLQLKDTASGDVTYDLSASSYDFSGVSNVELEIKAGDDDDIVAVTTAAALDEDGDLTVDFSAESDASFTLGDLTMSVNEAGIEVTFSNSSTSDPITFNSGDVEIDVDFSEVESLDAGEVTFTASVDGTTVTLAGSASSDDPIEGFGAELSGALEIEIDLSTFAFTKITGSDIALAHPDLEGEENEDNAISGIGFEIEDGALTKFDVESVVVVHSSSKLRFTLENGAYDVDEVGFEVAKLDFTSDTSLAVNHFKMKDDGTLEIGGLEVNIEKDPVYFNGTASWNSGYELSISGEVGSDVSFDGDLIFRAHDDFNVFYVAMSASSTGVPIGQTGLKLDGLGGRFGYNYRIFFSEGDVDGDDSEGNLAFGASVEVSDLLDFASLEAEALVNWDAGDSTTFEFIGNVNIPDSNDSYANFTLTALYEFWKKDVSGNVSTSVSVPKGDGSLIQMDTGDIEYAIMGSLNQWKLDADSAMTGKLFNAVSFEAEILAGGSLNDASDFFGWIDGSLSYDKTMDFNWPGDFDVGDCGWNKFGVAGSVDLKLDGTLVNVEFSSSSFSGEISASLMTDLEGEVQWPTLWGNECTVEFDASVFGDLIISRTNGITSATGELTVQSGDKTNDFDYTFNNLL